MLQAVIYLPLITSRDEVEFYLCLKAQLEKRSLLVHFWGVEQRDVEAIEQLNVTVFPWNLPHLERKPFESLSEPDSICKVAVDRHLLWNEIPPLGAIEKEQLLFGASHYREVFLAAIDLLHPAFVLIWNGEYGAQLLLRDALESRSVPVCFFERGLLHGSLFIDPKGLNQDSSYAAGGGAFKDLQKNSIDFSGIQKSVCEATEAWWDQPDRKQLEQFRAELKIPKEKTIVFFPGQVDADTSNFLFAPNFENNLEAFHWLCNQLSERSDLFILGKHHPKAACAASEYRRNLPLNAYWVEDVAIQDCLGLCDFVATVNSTVCLEAMFHGKPTLTLGKTLFSGQDVFYEVNDLNDAVSVIDEWLTQSDFDRKRLAFEMALVCHGNQSLVALNPEKQEFGLRSSDELAEYIAASCRNPEFENRHLSAEQIIQVIAKTCLHMTNPASRKQTYMANIISRVRALLKRVNCN